MAPPRQRGNAHRHGRRRHRTCDLCRARDRLHRARAAVEKLERDREAVQERHRQSRLAAGDID